MNDLKEGLEALMEDIKEPERLRRQSAVATWFEAEQLYSTSTSRSTKSRKKDRSTKDFSKQVQVHKRYIIQHDFCHVLIHVSWLQVIGTDH